MRKRRESIKNRTACVILAGGSSRRMKTDKAKLFLGTQTFLEILCEKFDFFDEKYIAGGNKTEMEGVCWPVFADDYQNAGPLGGIHAGLKKCRAEKVLFLSCDTPLLRPEIAELLENAWLEDTDLVLFCTEDGIYHPLCGLYKKSLINIIEKQITENNNCVMDVVRKARVRYVKCDMAEWGLYNINTPDDYEMIKKKWEEEYDI